MIKNNILIAFISVFFIGCSSWITGLYYNKDFNKNTPDYSFISICKDSVFYQAHNDILGQADYKGTWELINDTLILNIPKPCKTMSNQLFESRNLNSDLTRFDCKLLRSCGDTMVLSYDTLVINDIMLIPIDSNGIATIENEDIFKIEIIGLFDNFYAQRVFIPKDPKSNDYRLFVGETDEIQLASYSLISDKFLIGRNNLRPIYLENDTLKISAFQFNRHGKCRK
jgi:hypothetical protein